VAAESLSVPDGIVLMSQIATGAVVLISTALFVRRGQLYRVVRERVGVPTMRLAARLMDFGD